MLAYFIHSSSGRASSMQETKSAAAVAMAQHRPTREEKLIESVNALSPTDFAQQFFSPAVLSKIESLMAEKTGLSFKPSLLFPEMLRSECKDVLDACFALIEQSSAQDYKASEIKWSPSRKRREMLLPDMRYLVLRMSDHGRGNAKPEVEAQETAELHAAAGFISFMFTYEDGFEVVYVYEIHLAPALRRQGVGQLLMDLIEGIGRQVGVEKCMLTVFKANQRAIKWYERCGYVVDDFSPGPRVLRNGTVKEPSYLILSKRLKNVQKSNS